MSSSTIGSSHVSLSRLTISGFADSTGVPSEDGLLVDARTAWDYLMGKGATPGQVIVMGQSLGTGVSVGLVASLAREGMSSVLVTRADDR